jgi:hypothetical protein
MNIQIDFFSELLLWKCVTMIGVPQRLHKSILAFKTCSSGKELERLCWLAKALDLLAPLQMSGFGSFKLQTYKILLGTFASCFQGFKFNELLRWILQGFFF